MSIFGRMLVNHFAKSKLEGHVEVSEVNDDQPKVDEETMGKIIKCSKAVAALSVYAAASDGSITLDEYMEIDINVGTASKKLELPDDVKEEISKIYDNHDIKWEEVISFLDELSPEELGDMDDYLENIVKSEADNSEISKAEQDVVDQFEKYLESRK